MKILMLLFATILVSACAQTPIINQKNEKTNITTSISEQPKKSANKLSNVEKELAYLIKIENFDEQEKSQITDYLQSFFANNPFELVYENRRYRSLILNTSMHQADLITKLRKLSKALDFPVRLISDNYEITIQKLI